MCERSARKLNAVGTGMDKVDIVEVTCPGRLRKTLRVFVWPRAWCSTLDVRIGGRYLEFFVMGVYVNYVRSLASCMAEHRTCGVALSDEIAQRTRLQVERHEGSFRIGLAEVCSVVPVVERMQRINRVTR